jgi:hypothetical protein
VGIYKPDSSLARAKHQSRRGSGRRKRDGGPAAGDHTRPRRAEGHAVPFATAVGGQSGGSSAAGWRQEEEDGGGEARRRTAEVLRRVPAAAAAVAGRAVQAHSAAAARVLRQGSRGPHGGRCGHGLAARGDQRRPLLRHRVRAYGGRRAMTHASAGAC